jgi:hypothetical protein
MGVTFELRPEHAWVGAAIFSTVFLNTYLGITVGRARKQYKVPVSFGDNLSETPICNPSTRVETLGETYKALG